MVMSSAQSVRRLAFKIASYGVVHFVVAVLVTFALTRNWELALAVGVIEPFLQTVAYGLYDRLWHRIDRRRRRSTVEETAEAFTARLEVMDSHEQARAHGSGLEPQPSSRRIAIKTAAYGVMHFALAVAVVWMLTRDWRVALAVGVAEPLVQMLVFAAYDRIWARIEARKTQRATALAA